MADDGADFSPSRSRSPPERAASAGSRLSDEESHSPTWKEQRMGKGRMPAVLKPSKDPRTHGSRRRAQASRQYTKPKHVPAADRAARSSHGRRAAADQGGKNAPVPPPPPPLRRDSSHR
eukprot:5551631-Alexandrium_andersonii.AAC.1